MRCAGVPMPRASSHSPALSLQSAWFVVPAFLAPSMKSARDRGQTHPVSRWRAIHPSDGGDRTHPALPPSPRLRRTKAGTPPRRGFWRWDGPWPENPLLGGVDRARRRRRARRGGLRTIPVHHRRTRLLSVHKQSDTPSLSLSESISIPIKRNRTLSSTAKGWRCRPGRRHT
jgi:hypothetical protein